MVPALTPLMTSHRRFSFTLYLGSHLSTGRCLNNNPLSLDTEHLTEPNKRISLKSPVVFLLQKKKKVLSSHLNFVWSLQQLQRSGLFDHNTEHVSAAARVIGGHIVHADCVHRFVRRYLKSFFAFSPMGNCRFFLSNSLSKS